MKVKVWIVAAAFLFVPAAFFPSMSCDPQVQMKNGSVTLETDRDTIAAQMRRVLDEEFSLWYPLSIDTVDGGFFSDINARWQLEGDQNKMIVTQARHVWSAANAAMFYREDNNLRTIAAHGVEFLRTKMWDPNYGGFFNLVDRTGKPLKEGGAIIKQAYGNAFAIYGLAAYYRASGDTSVLAFAQETFHWLEDHSYDPQYGGYFQFMAQDGTPFVDGLRGVPPKDYNSMIHIFEAYTELYRVWPDEKLRERLNSMLHLIRDTFTAKEGYLLLYFQRDWKHVSYRDASASERERHYEFDHITFGHDVETAYLMLEASEALGLKDDAPTLQVAKKLVDHALRYGWDSDHGGIYDGGYYVAGSDTPTVVRKTKEWWSEVEAFNSFHLMSTLFPNDKMRYYAKFCEQWQYCRNYLIDPDHGGWYWGGIDMVPRLKEGPKGSIWKGNYHTSRGLINCIIRLGQETLPHVRKQ